MTPSLIRVWKIEMMEEFRQNVIPTSSCGHSGVLTLGLQLACRFACCFAALPACWHLPRLCWCLAYHTPSQLVKLRKQTQSFKLSSHSSTFMDRVLIPVQFPGASVNGPSNLRAVSLQCKFWWKRNAPVLKQCECLSCTWQPEGGMVLTLTKACQLQADLFVKIKASCTVLLHACVSACPHYTHTNPCLCLETEPFACFCSLLIPPPF